MDRELRRGLWTFGETTLAYESHVVARIIGETELRSCVRWRVCCVVAFDTRTADAIIQNLVVLGVRDANAVEDKDVV